MATDFNTKTITTSGSFKPSIANTPLDIRTRIYSLDDIENIPLPYVGMIFTLVDTENNTLTNYQVKSLKSKFINTTELPNALIDEYENFNESSQVDLSSYALKSEIPDISTIQTSLNKKANSADVYNKTQIDTKLSDIQSGNLVLSDPVQQDTSVIAPYEEDEIYGNILASDSMLYSLDTSVTSVGFKLSKAPRERQTIKLEVNNNEIIIDKTELYFDKNSFNEYQFINISFKEKS